MLGCSLQINVVVCSGVQINLVVCSGVLITFDLYLLLWGQGWYGLVCIAERGWGWAAKVKENKCSQLFKT